VRWALGTEKEGGRLQRMAEADWQTKLEYVKEMARSASKSLRRYAGRRKVGQSGGDAGQVD